MIQPGYWRPLSSWGLAVMSWCCTLEIMWPGQDKKLKLADYTACNVLLLKVLYDLMVALLGAVAENTKALPVSYRLHTYRLSLFVGTADCALTLLDARHGEPLGIGRDTWLRPKHADAALGLVLLDASGAPVRPLGCPCVLPWAGNTPAPVCINPAQAGAAKSYSCIEGLRILGLRALL